MHLSQHENQTLSPSRDSKGQGVMTSIKELYNKDYVCPSCGVDCHGHTSLLAHLRVYHEDLYEPLISLFDQIRDFQELDLLRQKAKEVRELIVKGGIPIDEDSSGN